jgi:NADH:ubiquinone oxidoreductase subunit F (NADH-binding)
MTRIGLPHISRPISIYQYCVAPLAIRPNIGYHTANTALTAVNTTAYPQDHPFMSKNIRSLSGRKGLGDNLFERIVEVGAGPAAAPEHQALAKEYLIGEAMTFGAASFYDFISEEAVAKKALVCDGSACLCAGTQGAVVDELKKHLDDDEIGHVTCLGRCHENAAFYYDGWNYSGAALDNLSDIISNSGTGSEDNYHVESTLDIPVLTAEFPGIDEYYAAFKDVLAKAPEEIVGEVKTANLRGRGGAGFPTGFKWDAARQSPSDKKYIVCNADEGDPGAYIDRYLLEKQPHSVLFGMMTAGRAIGADEGCLYIRAEYPDSVQTIGKAIAELEAAGIVGNNIFGSDFSFSFKIIVGAGAYICGEETALLASIEGRRPEVDVRPPYPTTEGLFRKPTVVNNVESFANIHPIMKSGGAAYAEIGTSASTGPKLVCLDGIFNRPGLYEVAMGTPLSTVIHDLGQGFSKPVKALHIGGPLGGLVPVAKFDSLTIDFESFRDGGFLLGHGSIVCVPEAFPMIKYVEHILDFCAFESCGKCFPCRLGSTRGHELISGAIEGGQLIDRELFGDLIETMEKGSLCAHGGGIPLPIRNALAYFDDELKSYFRDGAV